MTEKPASPPRFYSWMLRALSFHHYREMALGDLDELYEELVAEDGKEKADRWYRRQVRNSLPHCLKSQTSWSMVMIKNYVKITWRNLIKTKLFSFINVLGLALGLACFLLIFLWIQDETSFDSFHANKEDLYLLTIEHPNGILDRNVPYALAPALQTEFPEIAQYSRIFSLGTMTTCAMEYTPEAGNRVAFYEQNVKKVDPDFFTMFSFPFVSGEAENALPQPNSLVISERIAQKYFGDDEPLGKKMTLNKRTELVVSGVVRFPGNSHLDLDFMLSLDQHELTNWNWSDPSYVRLDPSSSALAVRGKIEDSMNRLHPANLPDPFKVGLLPVEEVNLGFGRSIYVTIFWIVAVLILLIACINYMNLATACSSRRAREVGMRRVIGARRPQLIFQFLSESMMMTVLALIGGVMITVLVLPMLNSFTEKQLSLFSAGGEMALYLLGLTILVGLVAGCYPALFLSASQPIDSLRSKKNFRSSRSVFRVVTVVSQFTISILLIISALTIYSQLEFVRSRPLGINIDSVLEVPLDRELGRSYPAIRNELLRNPGITHVTLAQSRPYNEDYKTGVDWPGKDPQLMSVVRYSIADIDFVEMFDLEVVQGRSFSRDRPGDRNSFLINEEAARYMGMEQPVGQEITFWGRTGTIIGVLKDFHHVSLHREILPQVFTCHPSSFSNLKFMFVKINPANLPETMTFVKETVEKQAPGYLYQARFIDEGLNRMYLDEEKLGEIFLVFAVVAVSISCLGIFGLSAYLAEQRTKEIGIRKVFGASTALLTLILSKSMIRWVLLANVIAWPVAWYITGRWLDEFAYRMTGDWRIFLLAGLTSLLISLATICYQTLKAAWADPADSLRYE